MSRHLLRRCAFLLFLPLALVRAVAQPMVLDPAFAPSLEYGGSAVESGRYAPAPEGRLYAFGIGYWASAYVNETPVAKGGIVRLRLDGSLDTSFTPRLATDEIVQDAAVLADGRVLVSTSYTSVTPQGRVVRLLTSGQVDATFAPTAIGGLRSARLTVLRDGSTIVWGEFDSVGGLVRNGLARVLADGAVDPAYAAALTAGLLHVVSLAATPDDGVVLSAATYQRGGISIGLGPLPAQGYHFVRLTRIGAIDPTFNPAPPSITSSVLLCLPDNRLIVGHHELRLLKADGSVDATFTHQIPKLQNVRNGALLPGNRLAVEVDTELPTLAIPQSVKSVFVLKLDGTIERDCRALPGAERIQFLRGALPDGRIMIIQGPMTWVLAPFTELSAYYIPGMAEPKLCVVDPAAGTLTALPTTIEVTGEGRVARLTLDPAGRVLADGSFTRIAGVSRRGFARFNLDGTLDATFAPAAAARPLYHMPDGRIIASQTTLGPVDAEGFRSNVTRVVRLNPDGTLDPTFTPAPDLDLGNVAWLATAADGRILVSVIETDGASARIPKLIWLGTDGARQTLSTVFPRVSSGPFIVGGAQAVLAAAILADGKLLIRPTTATINGAPSALLVRLNADGSTDSSYQANTSPLRDITDPKPLPDGRAYVMGRRFQIGSIQSSVLRLNPDGSPDTFVEPALAYGMPLADGSYLYGNSRYHPDGTRDMNYESPVPAFHNLNSAVLTRDGNIWMAGAFADSLLNPVRIGLGRMIPAEVAGFTVQPQQRGRTVVGLDAMFQAELGTAAPATFQWTFNGTPIAGATNRSLRIAHAKLSDAGEYRLVATVGGTTYTSAPATLTVDPNTTRLVNFSARSVVSPSFPPQIGGFVLSSPALREVLLRGIGRGLPVDNPGFTLLPRPTVTLFRGSTLLAQDSGGALAPAIVDAAARLGAFPPRSMFTDNQPTRDSALLLQLFPGAYTVHASSADGQTGVNLFEFYDADTADETPAVVNVSVRGRTAPGSDVLIAGFVVGGSGARRLLIRGIGPGLTALGVSGAVGNPQITLHNSSNIPGTNDNWNDQADVGELIDATQRTGAFPLAAGSRDAALLVTVTRGAYTVHGSSVDGTPGEMMIELYVVQD